jgi:hypothetical protein
MQFVTSTLSIKPREESERRPKQFCTTRKRRAGKKERKKEARKKRGRRIYSPDPHPMSAHNKGCQLQHPRRES